MWELDDWKWLNRVQELLSQAHDHHGLEFLKGKRSPRKKKEYYPTLHRTLDDHRPPISEKTGIKLTIKNLRKNPVVICTQMTLSKRTSFENPRPEAPETSTANLKRRRDGEDERSTATKEPPDLPPAFKNHILETGGSLDDVVLVIQKELFDSDLNKNLNRLSVPYSQVNSPFLNSQELDHLDAPKTGIQVTLLQPCLQECEISLRNWKSNSMFALASSWNEVWRRNQLRQGNTIQLWSFRRNSQLCFGLVLIK